MVSFDHGEVFILFEYFELGVWQLPHELLADSKRRDLIFVFLEEECGLIDLGVAILDEFVALITYCSECCSLCIGVIELCLDIFDECFGDDCFVIEGVGYLDVWLFFVKECEEYFSECCSV